VAPFAILAAEPLRALARAGTSRWRSPLRRAALLLLVVGVAGYLGVVTVRLKATTADSTLARRAAAWIDADAPGPKRIMAIGNEIAFYGRGDWMPLPYAASAEALAYIHRTCPTYIVLERDRVAARPYLAAWMRDGIPDRDAVLVGRLGGSDPQSVQIYAWRAP
jgi:hypothetical protein